METAEERIRQVDSPIVASAKLAISTIDWRDEMELQALIGRTLALAGHAVYFHHAKAASLSGERQFSVHGGSCRVDILVCTAPGWSRWYGKAHDEMPAIGIEVKLAKNLKWLKSGIQQVAGYVDEALHATYECAGHPLPRPTQFLIATDDSWRDGHLYRWFDQARFCKPREVREYMLRFGCGETEAKYILYEQAWRGLDAAWDQDLLSLGAAVLRTSGGTFQTNRFGAYRRYDLVDA